MISAERKLTLRHDGCDTSSKGEGITLGDLLSRPETAPCLGLGEMLSALSTASIRVLVINKDGLGCPSKLWFIDHLDSALSTASIRVLVINKDGLGCPSKLWFIDHLDSALSTTSIRVLVINKDGLGCPSNLWFIDHLDPALSTASIRVLVINKDGLGCPSKPWFIDHLGSKQLEACFMTAARRKMTVQLKATKKKVKPFGQWASASQRWLWGLS